MRVGRGGFESGLERDTTTEMTAATTRQAKTSQKRPRAAATTRQQIHPYPHPHPHPCHQRCDTNKTRGKHGHGQQCTTKKHKTFNTRTTPPTTPRQKNYPKTAAFTYLSMERSLERPLLALPSVPVGEVFRHLPDAGQRGVPDPGMRVLQPRHDGPEHYPGEEPAVRKVFAAPLPASVRRGERFESSQGWMEHTIESLSPTSIKPQTMHSILEGVSNDSEYPTNMTCLHIPLPGKAQIRSDQISTFSRLRLPRHTPYPCLAPRLYTTVSRLQKTTSHHEGEGGGRKITMAIQYNTIWMR